MRIRYYDWLEAVAIFLVCTIHQVWLKGTVASSVAITLVSMAVPLFFMVHGALLLNKEISAKKQLKRYGKVLFQVLAWNAIYLLYSYAAGGIEPGSITLGFLYNYFIGFVNSTGINSGHLWFIYALLAVYAFFPLLKVCKDHNEKLLKYIWLMCFVSSIVRQEVLLWGGYLGELFFGPNKAFNIEDFMRNLSPLGEYAHCILFFLTGYFLSQWVQTSPAAKQHRTRYMLLCLLAVVAGILLIMTERYIEFGQLEYNWKPVTALYKRVGPLLMASGMFVLFSQLDFKDGKLYQIVKTISIHTLDIFYIHVIYAWSFYRWFYRHDLAGVLPNFLRAAVVMVLAFLTGQIIRKIPVLKKLLA
ncbi:MAG: acyltransferase family protein [Oscillospiraceae bacterium]|nr:acyltransferase family protein [Oscillospiraceae bacterium]